MSILVDGTSTVSANASFNANVPLFVVIRSNGSEEPEIATSDHLENRMDRIDRFEQKALFSFTRALALFVVGVLLLGIIAAAVYLLSTLHYQRNTRVDPGEVLTELRPAPAVRTDSNSSVISQEKSGVSAPAALSGQRIAYILQPYLSSPKIRAELEMRLRALDALEADEYVTNLAEVVAAAENENLDGVKAMQIYLNAKNERIAAMEWERQRKKKMRLYIAGGVVSTLIIIALFSLILVLLAIERNTRSAQKQQEATA